MNENGSMMNGAPGRENGSDSGSDKNDKRVNGVENCEIDLESNYDPGKNTLC